MHACMCEAGLNGAHRSVLHMHKGGHSNTGNRNVALSIPTPFEAGKKANDTGNRNPGWLRRTPARCPCRAHPVPNGWSSVTMITSVSLSVPGENSPW